MASSMRDRCFRSPGGINSALLLNCYGSGFLRLFLLPGSLRSLGDEAFLERGGSDADITDLAIGQARFDPLEVGQKTPFGNGGHVRANAARLLGFAAAPDDAALHRAFACQFTKSRHIHPLIQGAEMVAIAAVIASTILNSPAFATRHPSAFARLPRAPTFRHRRAADRTGRARSPHKARGATRGRRPGSARWSALPRARATPRVRLSGGRHGAAREGRGRWFHGCPARD